MDFSFTYLVSVPVAMFFSGNSYTVSYGDSCFIILEVCHIFFRVYHMWHGNGICHNIFFVMLLVWCLHNKQFVVDYVFCDVVCIFFFLLFLLVKIILLVIFNFGIIEFPLVIFFLVFPIFSFLDYLLTVFLDLSGFIAVIKFCFLCNFFMPEVFSLCPCFSQVIQVPLYCDLHKEIFHMILNLLVLIVCSFCQIPPKYCNWSSKWLICSCNYIIFILELPWWYGTLQVSLIVCESSFLSLQCMRQIL